jgi:Holliday junction resolvase RusA-like endonuclease
MPRSTLSQFAEEFQQCWICDSICDLQIHHICGRRGKDPHDRRNLFRICDFCHRLYHDGSATQRSIDISHILYAKWYCDRAHYNPEFLASLRGRKHLGADPRRPEWWPYQFSITVLGKPIPQPRPRITRKGPPRAYVPSDHAVHAYRAAIAEEARDVGCDLTDKPVSVEIRVFFKRPKSHFSRGLLKESSPLVPAADVDNLAKAILDALTGVAYEDDKLVTRLVVEKFYTVSSEHTEVVVEHAA